MSIPRMPKTTALSESASSSGAETSTSESISSTSGDEDDDDDGDKARRKADKAKRGPSLSTVAITPTGINGTGYKLTYKKKKLGDVSVWGDMYKNLRVSCNSHIGCKFVLPVKQAPPDIETKRWIIKGCKCSLEEHRAAWFEALKVFGAGSASGSAGSASGSVGGG